LCEKFLYFRISDPSARVFFFAFAHIYSHQIKLDQTRFIVK